MSNFPKVTIITASYNAKSDLLKTIESIQAQDYPHLEYIVIDGGSQDGTREVLQADNGEVVTKWVSEPDKGISDAFNKAIEMASGTYLNFQGAGDTLANPDVLSNMMAAVDPSVDMLVCGKVQRIAEDGSPLWVAPKKMSKRFGKRSLIYKLTLPHQGLFMHQQYFAQYGNFDGNCQFAMDYELLLRSYHDFPKVLLKDLVVANWRAGGVGKNRISEIYDEYHRMKVLHKIAPRYWLYAVDKWNRLKYSVKSRLGCWV